ncbi:hypothetical protein chiPu_0030798, partial [Chiloscyllium punctatum]|nr:hypothetical protein [Chiloscyllium punctatum]
MKPEAWSQGLVWVAGLVLLLAAGLGVAVGRCIHGDVQRRAPGATRVGYGVGRALLGGTRPIRIVAHYPGSTDMVLGREDGLRLNSSIQEALALVRGLLA